MNDPDQIYIPGLVYIFVDLVTGLQDIETQFYSSSCAVYES